VRACLDAAAVRAWCAEGLDALRRHRQEIDDLNVYPVPDGDTGTNLVLTFTSAYEALNAEAPDAEAPDADSPDAAEETAGPGRTLRCLARGALLGARGNSGVILSQLLGGLADALAAVPEARGREFSAALARAAEAGYRAVADPVEGTVLTVARAAADAARDRDSDDLAEVCAAAAEAAAVALDHTPEQLPALARAGVVDAGGRGLVVLLDALAAVVGGTAPATARPPRPARDPSLRVEREDGSTAYAYEVQYLLDAPAVDGLLVELGGLGDSLAVVGTGEGVWNVHVHVNDVGAALEAGVRAGRPHRISVTRFADQERAAERRAGPRGMVVLAEGDGIAALVTAEGAAVVAGGSPSTREVLAAIRRTGAAEVVVLPDDGNSHAVCAAAAEEARRDGITVAVVPTRCAMQAVAALAVRDPGRPFTDDVIAMAEAAGATRCAELAVASRDALTSAGRCSAGDVLALVEGEVVLVTPGPVPDALVTAATELLDRMLSSGGELVTLILGTTAPDGLAQTLTRHLHARWPLVEVQTFVGGQPHHPLLLGVE
jgi:hypothetical protein